jgi:deoxycytidylate deaminase
MPTLTSHQLYDCLPICRCVIVRDGQVIGTGYNMTNHTRNVSTGCCAVLDCPHVPSSSAPTTPLSSTLVLQATRHAELEAVDKILADHKGDVAKAGFNRCAH